MTTTTDISSQVAAQMAKPAPHLPTVGAAVSNRSAALKSGYFVQFGRETPTSYIVLAAWLVPAIDEEDPGSVNCGCPLQGRSHVHAERRYDSYDDARLAYATAKCECAGRQPASLAPSHRIGGHA